MNNAILYSILRILMFLLALGGLWALGLTDPLWLILGAAGLSMLASIFLLSRIRERMSADVLAHVERRQERRARRSADEIAEDAEADDFR
ncbi:MAG: DUF4229 domain-containing protein [Mobilicoccus sp.]|nr:DUF4229 domain-containing protein [Mobilicoccus sp.]